MADARDQLQKLTECSICFKTFTDPRMLPCIHTFCLECLKGTFKAAKKKDGEKLPCPLCRTLFLIPTVGMNGLQKNFFMQHLIDVTTMINVGQKSNTDCDICKALHEGDAKKTKEATMLCLECGDNFCDMCARTHKLHKSSKTHSVVKMGGETEEDIRKMQSTRNCAVHNQQPLSFYCADCKKIICVSCFVENHASHKCKDVTSVETEFRKTIEMNALKIANFAKEILSKGSKTEQGTTEVFLHLTEAESKIRKRNIELKEMVDSQTNSLLYQLSQIKEKHVKNSAMDKVEIDRIHTVLKGFETYCTELRLKGSSCDVCGCVDELVARTNELEKDHKAFIGRPYNKTEVSFKATDLKELLRTSGDNIVGQIVTQSDRSQQGLGNTGGNNYFSAVIHCLSQTHPFREVLCSRLIPKQQHLPEAFFAFLNYRYLGSLEQNEASFKVFGQLYKSSPTFINFRHHDNRDFFLQVLNDLKSAEVPEAVQSSRFNVDTRNDLTAVDKVFGGHFITIYDCQSCNESNIVCKSLFDITLPIYTHQYHQNYYRGHAGYCVEGEYLLEPLNVEEMIPTEGGGRYHTRPITLTECLRFYTLTEQIPDGCLCSFCDYGQEAAAAANLQTTPPDSKRTLIYNPPVVLVLHMKRFEKTATGFIKRSDRVTYEEFMDLGPYCSSDCLRIDPTDKNVWYSLYGVIVHSGSVESGNYSAYVKIRNASAAVTETYLQKTYLDCDEVSEQLERSHNRFKLKNYRSKVEWQPKPETHVRWVFTDNDTKRHVTLQEALNQEAFMLFYERVPKLGQ